MVNFTAGPLRILGKKRKKIKGLPRSRSAAPNKRPRGFPSISRVRLMTANVDEDDCNKCWWFTGSLDKGYHHTELMVYARQHAADISDSEAFRVNTEGVRRGGGTFCSNAALTHSEHADRAADETGEVLISPGCHCETSAASLRSLLWTVLKSQWKWNELEETHLETERRLRSWHTKGIQGFSLKLFVIILNCILLSLWPLHFQNFRMF